MSLTFRPCVLVPTRNHVQELPALLQHMACLELPVLVVDDGSDPKERRAIEGLARAGAAVRYLRHERNQGKGAAVLSGLHELAAQGFSHALQIDADGQHDLGAVSRFLEAAREHPDAVIAGQPLFDRSIPLERRLGRWITRCWVVTHTLSPRIGDSMCGFRVYPVAPALALAARTRIGRGMDFDTEILVRLFWAGTPVAGLPVRVVYPPGNFSNFRLLDDNLAITRMHTRLFFGMLRRLPGLMRAPPRRIDLAGPTGRHWADLRERGVYWGLLLLMAAYRRLGRHACLTMMIAVVLYFFVTGGEQRRASAGYLRRLHAAGHLARPPGLLMQFHHFMSFARSALDTVAAWNGDIRVAALKGVDEDALAAAKTTDRGAFVVTAHLGNPEVIRAVADLNRRWRVNVLVHTRHAEHFNRLLARIAPDAGFRLIQVADLGVDTAILLKEAVDRGEWVVSVADRIPVGAPGRVTWVPFLGEPAPFSQGPFILASLLEIPIFTMFCLREDATYRVWFEKLADGLQLRQGARDELLREVIGRFVARLEARLVQAPLQWFNFFDFWHPRGLEPPHQRPSTLPHSHGKHEDSGRA